ncbi:MAG: transporter substrate-binding domain-containing protein [Desulfobacterales bacterium]|nr:transporter substrate-binding domain-containing protein [Desulfobacterales bacterium]
MKKIILILFLILMSISTQMIRNIYAKTLKFAIDDRNWYPFTYVDNEQAKGMHVEVVIEALKNLGYQFEINPLPRKRCIKSSEAGVVDGVISIAYNSDLAKIIEFPKDAANPPLSQWKTKESAWRIMQVDFMVITHSDAKYNFQGDIKTLPIPIRIPMGETFVSELNQANLLVEEAREDIQNFGKLIRDKNGCVITTSIIAENMNKNPEFSGKFIIQATPLSSQSYFLAFSRKSSLTQDEKDKIWDEIQKLRDDYVFMLVLFSQY